MTQTMLAPSDDVVLPELGPKLMDTTPYLGNFVVVHSLTTMLGVNPNRDFQGMPKRLSIGGQDRLRISSQCKARTARMFAREFLSPSNQAARTRRLPEVVASILEQRYGRDAAEAGFTAAAIVAATGMGIDWARPKLTTAVMYVRADAGASLATLANEHWDDLALARDAVQAKVNTELTKPKKGKGKKAAPAAAADGELALGDSSADTASPPAAEEESGGDKNVVKPEMLSSQLRAKALAVYDVATNVEVSLWGRMLANIPQLNVDSAIQIGHAFAVDPIEDLFDEFTVVDDLQDDETFGAANQGQQVLASGTLYQFAALDRRLLRRNLAQGVDGADVEPLAQYAEQVFTASVVWGVPSGKRSRTGSSALPTLAIAATTDMAATAAATFEKPITGPAGVEAAHRLADYLRGIQRATPYHGGSVWWLSPDGSQMPDLSDRLQLLA